MLLLLILLALLALASIAVAPASIAVAATMPAPATTTTILSVPSASDHAEYSISADPREDAGREGREDRDGLAGTLRAE